MGIVRVGGGAIGWGVPITQLPTHAQPTWGNPNSPFVAPIEVTTWPKDKPPAPSHNGIEKSTDRCSHIKLRLQVQQVWEDFRGGKREPGSYPHLTETSSSGPRVTKTGFFRILYIFNAAHGARTPTSPGISGHCMVIICDESFLNHEDG